ncbi:type III-A CRISPR-associated RAMP protein Csm3 [Clostridiaceae bacterium UIB06]|uniref:CRISPR system Cms endoribonuclease Csm3 n=1 Tax=Clostridium thailandense TaxID=2794346 RepID=A0A949TX36_9CLOT|nr:type III-A CRISPR-associated RAMP protein Csm3 [Clostridium thailandense]MBV7275126.1 type III-A CRISPR-associated RAMP protein Csm3 [Clostridium thailandense]MCH5136917.1 type III-A CRISPR-associated RAMP protein Csm3 [Clostridiaceae bacterium UIB06]
MIGRLIINADLVVKTGLHIGGGSSSVEIGGIDNSVIKSHKGEPYIPGSSLKGKLRSLTELAHNKMSKNEKGENLPCDCGECFVCKIYGISASEKNKSLDRFPTRIIVRDAFLKKNIAEDMRKKEGDFKDLELSYTESKWENSIDRLTSKANPRLFERVPEGAIFDLEIVYTIYNERDIDNIKRLMEGFQFLEDDYLGGNGTRGYGKVKLENIKFFTKTINDYTSKQFGDIKASVNEIDDIWFGKLKEQMIDAK